MAVNSFGAGRAVGAGVAGAAVAGGWAAGVIAAGGCAAAAGAVAIAPVGAGADAAVVAGRLAQPAKIAVLITKVATMSWEPRVTMTPPFRTLTAWISQRRSILSRQARRPRRTGGLCGATRDRRLRRSVDEHRKDLPRTEPIRLEHQMPAVRRPRRPLIITGTAGEAPGIRAIRIHGPDVVGALAHRVHDDVALRRPARLRVAAAGGERTDVRALGVHHEHVRRAAAVGDE